MKKLTFILCAALLLLCSCSFRTGNKIELYDWERDYFGDEVYAELERPCSDDDREELLKIEEIFRKAINSNFNTYEEAEKALGSVLAYRSNFSPEAYRAEQGVNFLTGRIEGDKAYVWLEYWYEDRNKANNNLGRMSGTESQRIKVRIEAEKSDGEWTIVDTNEHP